MGDDKQSLLAQAARMRDSGLPNVAINFYRRIIDAAPDDPKTKLCPERDY